MIRLCAGKKNPARDAAREAKRQRRSVLRGTVPKDVQLTVQWDSVAGAWQAFASAGYPHGAIIAFGRTPTSAVIAAEIEIFKRAR